jgi:hypothetical protein
MPRPSGPWRKTAIPDQALFRAVAPDHAVEAGEEVAGRLRLQVAARQLTHLVDHLAQARVVVRVRGEHAVVGARLAPLPTRLLGVEAIPVP